MGAFIKLPPGTTPEAREKQLIAAAVELAEKQILNGTASSQVITFYLKLSAPEVQKKNLLLDKQIELVTAKTEAIKSQKRVEELYSNAMKAMQIYQGDAPVSEEDYDGDF